VDVLCVRGDRDGRAFINIEIVYSPLELKGHHDEALH